MTQSHQAHHRHHAGRRAHLLDVPSISRPIEDVQNSRIFRYAISLAKRTPPTAGSSSSGGSGSSSGSGTSGGSSSNTGSSGSAATGSSGSSSSSSSGADKFAPDSGSSCLPNDNSPKCQKPISDSSNTTIPIVLGVVIPLTIALVIFLFLHRRHVKKLRQEDANDKHGSLDFGMGNQRHGVKQPKGKKGKGPNAIAAQNFGPSEKDIRGGRGLSMDMSMGSPYLLPPGLQNSRESLHSLSRTIHNGEDRYRIGTNFTPGDGSSVRSFPTSTRRGPGLDNASVYTGSSDHMNQELLRNASRMSRSSPPHPSNLPTIQTPEASAQVTRKGLPSNPKPSGLAPPTMGGEIPRDSYIEKDGGDMRRSNNYLGAFINSRDSTMGAAKSHSVQDSVVEAPTSQPSPPRSPPRNARSPPANELSGTPVPPTLEVHPPDPVNDRQHSMEADIVQMPVEHNYVIDGQHYEDEQQIPPSQFLNEQHIPPHQHTRSISSSDKPLPVPPSHPLPDGPLPPIETHDAGFYDLHAPQPEHDHLAPHPAHDHVVPYPDQDRAAPYPDQDRAAPYPDQDRAAPFPDPNTAGPYPEQNTLAPYQQEHDTLAPYPEHDTRRLSMGFRPLPPEDPSDDPEQRANRIRSFYKEYFDESKVNHGQYAPQYEEYYEDYGDEYYDGQEYYGDGGYFDPNGGNFVMPGAPYAEPMTRRAMTPPPRAPPRFQGPPRGRTGSFSSTLMPPGPRPYSSASGAFRGGPRGRPGSRKPGPPPAPLRTLPTPHMLREDSFAMPIDFAPPTSYKDRQAGRPASPRGQMMPYNPALPAHLPLASAYDELSSMPSPHAMRKSGTFTGLDFAPPPRFKFNGDGNASDAGSIRSNRSAMSQKQVYNIRSGAYRLSRLPKDTVGTKNDLASSLRPTWDMK